MKCLYMKRFCVLTFCFETFCQGRVRLKNSQTQYFMPAGCDFFVTALEMFGKDLKKLLNI
jgi:hypothetical protein